MNKLFALAYVSGAFASGASAGITTIDTQAAFSAAGTIAQNTNFDTNGADFTFPGSPYTIGALTFVAGGFTVIGGQSYEGLARSLISDGNEAGTTVQSAGSHNLFGFNAGNFLNAGTTTIDIVTNLGSYQFTPSISSAANGGALTFLGFEAGAGEYFSSVRFSGGNATGATDLQIGDAGAIPEPATWALMIIGLGVVGIAQRRRTGGYATT